MFFWMLWVGAFFLKTIFFIHLDVPAKNMRV